MNKTRRPVQIHRNLVAYSQAPGKETDQKIGDPARLIPVMLERFKASDRALTKSA